MAPNDRSALQRRPLPALEIDGYARFDELPSFHRVSRWRVGLRDAGDSESMLVFGADPKDADVGSVGWWPAWRTRGVQREDRGSAAGQPMGESRSWSLRWLR